MKKLLSIGTISGTLVSSMAFVSCGYEVNKLPLSTLDILEAPDLETLERFELSDLPKDEQIWVSGIRWFAYQEGASFILNISKQLGWQPPEDKHFEEDDLPQNLDIMEKFNNLISQKPSSPLEDNRINFNQKDGDHHDNNYIGPYSIYLDPMGAFSNKMYTVPWFFGLKFEDIFGKFDRKGYKFGELKFANIASYHDGDKPGTNIMKAFLEDGHVYSLETTNDFNEIYEKYSTEEMIELRKSVVNAVSIVKSKLKNAIEGPLYTFAQSIHLVSTEFKDAILYLANNDFTNEQLYTALDSLNNGSHYLKAVEVFINGINFTPEEWRLEDNNRYSNGELKGFAEITDLLNLQPWVKRSHNWTHEDILKNQ